MGYRCLIFGIFDLVGPSGGAACTDFGSFCEVCVEIGTKLRILIELFMKSICVSIGRLMAS